MSKIWLPQFGVFGCECVAKSLPLLQTVMLIRGDIRESLDLYQGCYHTGVGASAGTHDKGGCVDTGQYADRHLKTARTFGWCAQHRTPAQGFDPHCHMFPNGCPHMSPLAQSQQWAWNHGRNGLVSNGPVTGPGPTGTDTPNWKTGVRRMEKEIMAFADDVAAKAAAQVLKSLPANTWKWDGVPAPDPKATNKFWAPASYLREIYLRVVGLWTQDTVPAPTADPKNPKWAPQSYLRNTYLEAHAINKELDSVRADLAAIKKKLGA